MLVRVGVKVGVGVFVGVGVGVAVGELPPVPPVIVIETVSSATFELLTIASTFSCLEPGVAPALILTPMQSPPPIPLSSHSDTNVNVPPDDERSRT